MVEIDGDDSDDEHFHEIPTLREAALAMEVRRRNMLIRRGLRWGG